MQKSEDQATYNDISIVYDESRVFYFRYKPVDDERSRYYVLRYSGHVRAERSGDGEMPGTFALMNPYPNPFNPATTIEFHVPEPAGISIDIYDAAGKFVRNLWNERTGPGIYRLMWDGRNSNGNLVSSGIFFCRLTINKTETMTRKLVMLR